MIKALSIGLFLRINTRSDAVAKACVNTLCGDNEPLVIRSTALAQLYTVDPAPWAPTYNSGDIIIPKQEDYVQQEHPSKSRSLHLFSNEAHDSSRIFTLFNKLNDTATQDRCVDGYQKPNFSDTIRTKFNPQVVDSRLDAFVLLVASKNTQVLLHAGRSERLFNWFAVHDDYTHMLVATQQTLEELEDQFLAIPGVSIFAMAIPGTASAIHPIFLTQKYRRLEKSTDVKGGNLRALAGVEEYLARVSN